MDDMVAQGFGAIVIIYGGLIVIALGILFFITEFWDALVAEIPALSSFGVQLFLCRYRCIQDAVFYSVNMELPETTKKPRMVW